MNNNDAEQNVLQDAGRIDKNTLINGKTFLQLSSASNYSLSNVNPISLENSDLNKSFKEKCSDQCRSVEQENDIMALKVSEYEKAITERDFFIESLQADVRNYQHNLYNLNNQFHGFMESNTSIRLGTNFEDISKRINGLGNTVDYLRLRQNDVVTTANTFQEKIIHMSCIIDNTLKQVNMEKERLKEDVDNLKNNLQCFHEIENLKSENDILTGKLNAVKNKLNEEKESVLKKNQHFEQVIKDTVDQNVLLMNDIKVITDKYNTILAENHSLKDELAKLNISLNKNKEHLDLNLKTIEDQAALNYLKKSEELNELQNDNFTLKERNEHLEKINTELMDDIRNIILYQNTIQEESDNKIIHKFNVYEDKILKLSKELELQKENENTKQNEVINLKQEVQRSHNTIINLQQELKLNLSLIPELQNKVDNFNNDLTLNNKKLQDCTTEFAIEKSKLEKEKKKLENQIKEQNLKLAETTANYMEYKSKAKLLYSEITKLQQQYCQLKQKISPECRITEIIEISDGEENKDASVSNGKFVGDNISNKSVACVSYRLNRIPSDYLSIKNSTSINISNTTLKKQKTTNDADTQSADCSNNMKQNCTQSFNNGILNLRKRKSKKNATIHQVNSSNMKSNIALKNSSRHLDQ